MKKTKKKLYFKNYKQITKKGIDMKYKINIMS